MDDARIKWRLFACVALGALSCLLLPVNATTSTLRSVEPLALGSAIACSLVAGCVVGLLGAGLERGWMIAACSAAAACLGLAAFAALGPARFSAFGFAAATLVAAGAGLTVAALARTRRAFLAETVAVAVVLLVALWFAGVLPGPLAGNPASQRHAALAEAPQPEHYTFDGKLFLRTYLLMKGGEGYYQAFGQAIAEDSRHDDAFLTSPFNYREPLLFEIWRVLPGSDGNALFAWFVIWSLATMIAAYLLASRLVEPGVALLAPVALTAFYYYFWWAGLWFMIVELWAAGLAVIAVAALVRERRIASIIALTAAVATREFMVLLIPAWVIAWWLSGRGEHKRTWWLPVLAIAGPAAVLAAHLLAIPRLAPGGSGATAWLHGGPERAVAALRFGWNSSVSFDWAPLALAAAALAAAALARPRWRTGALLAVTVIPTLFLSTISGGEPWRYWGAFYTPLAVAIAPGILGRLMPACADESPARPPMPPSTVGR